MNIESVRLRLRQAAHKYAAGDVETAYAIEDLLSSEMLEAATHGTWTGPEVGPGSLFEAAEIVIAHAERYAAESRVA